MSTWSAQQVQAVTGGTWLRPPRGERRLEGVGIDSRTVVWGEIFLAVPGPRHDGHDFLAAAAAKGAGLLVVERPVQVSDLPEGVGVLQVAGVRAALGALGADHRQRLESTTVIAITGSAGKTTTKSFIHAALSTTMQGRMAPRSFNNDVGVPLTLLSARPGDRYLVVEIGTNAPGEVAALARLARPDIAVMTMIGHGHLEGLGGIDGVRAEKLALLDHLRPGGLAILSADCPHLRDACPRGLRLVRYGAHEAADLRLTGHGDDESGGWLEADGRHRYRIPLPGLHNARNALAAVAVARELGVVPEQIGRGLASTAALPMRLQRHDAGGITVWNDAYNANPESMASALAAFDQLERGAARRVLVLGDMLELGPHGPALHRDLADRIIEMDQRHRVDLVVLLGELMAHACDHLVRRWDHDRVVHLPRAFEAVAELLGIWLGPGDAVLVKGSRAMALERVVQVLLEAGAAPAEFAVPVGAER